MKGLIIKDILGLKKYMRSIVGILAVMTLVAIFIKDVGYIRVLASLFFILMIISTFTIDDFSKFNAFGASMPVTRKEMVLSKYLLALAFTFCGTILSIILSVAVSALCGIEMVIMDEVMVSLATMVVGIFLVCLVLPLIYKFGTEHMRFIIIALGLIPTIIVLGLKQLGVPMPSEEQIEFVFKMSPALALIAIIVSYMISARIFCKKDF